MSEDTNAPTVPQTASFAFGQVAAVADTLAASSDSSADRQALFAMVSRYRRAAELLPDYPLTASEAFRGLAKLAEDPALDADSQLRARLYGAVAARRGYSRGDDVATARCAGAWMLTGGLLAAGNALKESALYAAEAMKLYQNVYKAHAAQVAAQPQPAT